ncbi:biopolymer transporter ExbD [Telluria mixta]|jgi:biopolymer transport protein ExbD|uniref:Biopolymer transporter ExbD n=1 Tax=Telluria mixta TaxID=34071 RepID=A0ABT2BXM8_9BURK|nr:biopolymer transporter ExbD [Telluria mixta]MBW8901344.1 biopolymer transporter ExbD [Massilia sp.]MCS0613914.1 biopolymer transporter ExbD [Massilia kyonggiensis]MCS0629883.1 biopolymer transporter ExbD [Telluria mixta]WEM96563.1 biopolymer transporter ExbD [Telluria mixta]
MAFSTGKDSSDVVSEINITPLVDVMLVLMVVFILTAPLLNNAVRINLPKTSTTEPANPTKSVTVSVDGASKIYIDKREVDLAALEPELKSVVATNPELAVSLQADEGVPYRAVAKVIANIQRSGVTKLSVLTQPGG